MRKGILFVYAILFRFMKCCEGEIFFIKNVNF